MKCKKIKKLFCVDADARAVEAARQNISALSSDSAVEAEYLWYDLTRPCAAIKNLDAVLMNPPFHSGKKTDIDLGKAMIGTACNALRKGGQLFMVANAHLPYERVLRDLFHDVETRAEKAGFKIFHALK